MSLPPSGALLMPLNYVSTQHDQRIFVPHTIGTTTFSITSTENGS